MANALPFTVTGAPNLRIEQSPDDSEYYGIMTYIRIDGIGEAQEDPHGLVMQLCGTYPPNLLEKIARAINGRR